MNDSQSINTQAESSDGQDETEVTVTGAGAESTAEQDSHSDTHSLSNHSFEQQHQENNPIV